MERQRAHSYQHHYPPSSQHHSYIKMCVDEAQSNDGPQGKDQSKDIRFTFNKLIQDVIEEQENDDDQEFHKVDYSQIIELRKMMDSYKAENIRLTQQSNDNLHLFNTYMQEMQERDAEKKGEIESLKYRIKLLQERYFKSQEQLRKAEFKLSHYNTSTKQQAVQCETKTIFKLSHPIDTLRTSKNQDKEASIHLRNKKISVFQKQNNFLHNEVVDLNGNYRGLAQSIEKETKLKQVQQQYKNLKSIYFKSLNNSPRASIKQRNKSIVTELSKMEIDRKCTPLNSLISPRIGSYNQTNTYEQNQTDSRRGQCLLSVPLKFDKQICKSTLIDPSSTLQFDFRRHIRQQRKK